jgi:hypothetical protein
MFECAAIQQIRRNAGGSERMAAGGVGESGLLSAPLDHLKDIETAHRVTGEIVALVHASKQRLLLFRRYARRLDPVIKVNFQSGVARHLVPFATFFVEPQPPAFAMLEVISDAHTHRRSDLREAIDHRSN